MRGFHAFCFPLEENDGVDNCSTLRGLSGLEYFMKLYSKKLESS